MSFAYYMHIGFLDVRHKVLAKTLVEETGLDIALVTNADFGHTEPQWLLPLGCEYELDLDGRQLTLLEPAVI